MTNTMMRRALFMIPLLASACDPTLADELQGKRTEAELIMENLARAGFPASEIELRDDGAVLVGGDAIVSYKASRELAGITSDDDAPEFRQYRTTYIINTQLVGSICVDPTSDFEANAAMLAALDTAIARYNAQGLDLTLARDGAGCDANTADATIAARLNDSSGGVAGFPADGLPYHEFFVGQDLANNYGADVATHVIMHELGHCVGFRHTDYFDRSISCGGGGDEGQADVGAVHIGGTPHGAVPDGSVMNACFNVGSDGLWTDSDITALDCLYGSGSGSEGCLAEPPPVYYQLAEHPNLSKQAGSELHYGPFDASELDAIRFSISGGSGDADLYVQLGAAPTTSSYDCRPYLTGSNESCSFDPAEQDDYFVMIRAYQSFSGVTFTVEGAGGDPPELCSNGADDDGDGDTDCDDSECSNALVCQPWTELLNADFESGWEGFTDGGGDAKRSDNSDYARSGNRSVRLRDDSGSSHFRHKSGDGFDLSGYAELHVNFWYYPRSMESGERFLFEVHNGSSWDIIKTYTRGIDFSNGSHHEADFTLDANDITFSSDTRIRFRNDASGDGDYVYFDDIVISAR